MFQVKGGKNGFLIFWWNNRNFIATAHLYTVTQVLKIGNKKNKNKILCCSLDHPSLKIKCVF